MFTEDQYYQPTKEEIAADLKAKEEAEKMKIAALAEIERNRPFKENMDKIDSVARNKMKECGSAKSKILIGLLAIYGTLDKIPKGALTMLDLDKTRND